MKILNVGCGGVRPGPPFVNVDTLRSQLAIGAPERVNLDREENYVDFDISFGLPFPPDSFDAACLIHVVEHFDCHMAVKVLESCYRVLKPGGLLVVSVPDAKYFLSVHDLDTPERAVELFGEPIHDKWQKSFFDYALFHREHKQILSSDSLECLLLKAGFGSDSIYDFEAETEAATEIRKIMNRQCFSIELSAEK